jgi:DNA-directed DNA polymerase
MLKPTTIDFETMGIEGRPNYPPIPVGVSIKKWGRPSKYYAFGHRCENNCSWGEVKDLLEEAYENLDGILFQNAKFDLDVAEVHLGIKIPEWQRVHDTMLLLFLDDPNQLELSLKPAAKRLLGWEPEEQDAIADWLIKNPPAKGVKVSKGGKYPFGAYIAYAPGGLVGKYANGDVDRTEAIFKLLYPRIVERGMLNAYNRERQLLPILLEMERQGLPVDLPRLREDLAMYKETQATVDQWVRDRLGADEELNLDSGEQLFNAMLIADVVDRDKALLTPTGKYQTNKDALLLAVTDETLLAMLQYRSQLKTCVSTFMEPWHQVAEQSGGLIYTTWNQVKAPRGAGNAIGTRTGRLSSTPNFQNIPKSFKSHFKTKDTPDKPAAPIELPALPKIRSYVVAFPGEVLVDRDFSQQEVRILAHYDGGVLLEIYQSNPWVDFHTSTQETLADRGKVYERKFVKTVNFGLIYGMGNGALAASLGITVEEAAKIKKDILTLYPGIKELYKDMKACAKTHTPIHTWGGREYYCEEPKMVNGAYREFDYKMVNTLIQGSAADCTKEAIIRFHAAKRPSWRILLNVHDQITVSVPPEDMEEAMEVLRTAMESIEFDVEMLSEGSVSTTNWAELIKYDEKGKVIYEAA